MFRIYDPPIYAKTKASRDIQFDELVSIIKDHPQKEIIHQIRECRRSGKDDMAKKLKADHLPFLNPNGRINGNEKVGTGYIYLDIDEISVPVEQFKSDFIQKYGHFVKLISFSASARGISALVPISHILTNEKSFKKVYDFVLSHFADEVKPDKYTKRFANQNWYLPYDPDVFINPNPTCLEVGHLMVEGDDEFLEEFIPDQSDILDSFRRNGLQIIEEGTGGSDEIYIEDIIHRMNPLSTKLNPRMLENEFISIISKFNTETVVEFDGKVHFEKRRVNRVQIRRIHPDGTKRKSFAKYAHDLLHFNPTMSERDLYLILYLINELYARPKMNIQLVQFIASSNYEIVKNSPNYTYTGNTSNRIIHYEFRRDIPRQQRFLYANRYRGLETQAKTAEQLEQIFHYCVATGIICTKRFVSDNTGLSFSTIKRYRDKTPNVVKEQIKRLEQEIREAVTEIYLEKENLKLPSNNNDNFITLSGRTF